MDQNDIADRYEAWKDTMTEPSKTPRTDAVVIAGEHEERGLEEYVPASFARELELSLSESQSAARSLAQELGTERDKLIVNEAYAVALQEAATYARTVLGDWVQGVEPASPQVSKAWHLLDQALTKSSHEIGQRQPTTAELKVRYDGLCDHGVSLDEPCGLCDEEDKPTPAMQEAKRLHAAMVAERGHAVCPLRDMLEKIARYPEKREEEVSTAAMRRWARDALLQSPCHSQDSKTECARRQAWAPAITAALDEFGAPHDTGDIEECVRGIRTLGVYAAAATDALQSIRAHVVDQPSALATAIVATCDSTLNRRTAQRNPQ